MVTKNEYNCLISEDANVLIVFGEDIFSHKNSAKFTQTKKLKHFTKFAKGTTD